MEDNRRRRIDPERRQKQLEKNRQYHGTLLAIAFSLLLLLFVLVNLLHKQSTFSDNENRMLQTFPPISLSSLADGSYASSMEAAVADQFVGRDGWISAKVRIDRFLGRRESNGVLLCADHYLMQVPAVPDPAVLDRTLSAMSGFADRHKDLKVSAMIVPNAVSMLENLLPENVPIRDQREDLTQISQTLCGKMQFIDVSDTLKQHGSEGVFYRTDHHWTSLGAYYAFEASAPLLGIESPASDYEVHILSNRFEGTLASKSGQHGVFDAVTAYEPKNVDVQYYVNYEASKEKAGSVYVSSCLEGKDKYTVFFGGNHPIVDIKSTANNGRTLLLFKDSYANCFVPFLIPYFNEIIMIDPRYYYDEVELVISQRSVTDVMFLYNLNTFLGDTALADSLEVPETVAE